MVAVGVILYFLYSLAAGIVLAFVLGGVLVLIGQMVVPGAIPGRRKFLRACFGRPFLLIPWMLCMFIVYSYANGIIFHRDNGLGVDVHAPIPDHYLLGYVNYNLGYLLTPETTMGTFPNKGPGTVDGVLEMQIAGPYIVGSRYLPSPAKFDDWRTADGKYFLLDTGTKSLATFFTLEDLQSASASKGIDVSFESPLDVYSRYRRTWFDQFLPVVSAVGLVGLLGSLWREAVRVRLRSADSKLNALRSML